MTEDDGAGWGRVFDAETPHAEVLRLAEVYAARALDTFRDELAEDHPELALAEVESLVAVVRPRVYAQTRQTFTTAHARLQQ